MLIGPRITEYLYSNVLGVDGILSDPTVLRGGVHRDVLPEDQRDYPAMVVSYISSEPTAFQATGSNSIDAFFQIEAITVGTDIDPLRIPTDRADVLVRRIGRTPDVSPDGRPVTIEIVDGVRIGNVRRVAETNRTTGEVGQYYAHLGAQYVLTAAEPDLAGQSGQ